MEHARKANTKKRVAALAAAAALLALAAVGTAAFYNVSGQAHNVITTKGIEASIHEYQLGPEGEWVDYEDPSGVMPGQTVSKIPVAESSDKSAPAWVRMRADVSVKAADGSELPASVVTIHFNAEGWTQGEGCWWYCNEPLETAGRTAPLFESVSLDGPGMGNIYQKCTISVDVSMQAVQTANNGASALEAAGWPDAAPNQEGGEE